MKTNPNDEITPNPETYRREVVGGKPTDFLMYGLTKREYFAAMAMQGLTGSVHELVKHTHKSLARESVKIADALIAELNKEDEK